MSINITSNIASSETCQYIALLYYDSSNNLGVKESIDYGASFTSFQVSDTEDQNDTAGATPTVAMSANGQYQAICSRPDNNSLGYIWISDDFGHTWTKKMTDEGRNWIFISVSTSGQYMIANTNGVGATGTYVSDDYGDTWTQTSLTQSMYTNLIPGNGQIMYTNDSDNVWHRSLDYGENWASFLDLSGTPINLTASANGQYISYMNGNSIYVSSNNGSSFTNRYTLSNLTTNNKGFVMSKSGQILMIFLNNNSNIVSLDYGISWNLQTNVTSNNISSVSLSYNGDFTVLLINNALYISKNPYFMKYGLILGSSQGTHPAEGEVRYDLLV